LCTLPSRGRCNAVTSTSAGNANSNANADANANANANANAEGAQCVATQDGQQQRSQWTMAVRSQWIAAAAMGNVGAMGGVFNYLKTGNTVLA
jgi:hypothetical protein